MEIAPDGAVGGIGRTFHLLRLLAETAGAGARLTELAGRAALPRPLRARGRGRAVEHPPAAARGALSTRARVHAPAHSAPLAWSAW